ncbi:unnamed protein product [Lactuca saligna]|uniref:F-box associated beta-propeller type 3 domain-containing protein n=1 Tax=Lactuca saligna TaxID=75948 RepID=A0AA36EIY4_LACSI|nr:unnamed protein product [Lactuca saligna]
MNTRTTRQRCGSEERKVSYNQLQSKYLPELESREDVSEEDTTVFLNVEEQSNKYVRIYMRRVDCSNIYKTTTQIPPRFRSLSTSLYTCISSPGFMRMHTFRSPQKIRFTHENINNHKIAEDVYTLHGEDELPLCLCPKRGYIGITTTIPFPCSNRFRTIGSCNGTFCLKTKNGFTLWNPSIRRKVRVPKCPRSSKLALGGIGFGFDPISDDYKIVWISYEKDTSFVSAVKTGTCCEVASPKPVYFCVI